MKIAIDTRMIAPFKHGISRYTYNLIKVLSAIDKKNDYVLISNNNYLEDFVSSHENFSLKLIASKLYGVREQFVIPIFLKTEKIDIFHSPSFFGPILGKCKVIMTIHDVIPMLFPKDISLRYRAYFNVIVKTAAKNASRIITVSENSKLDIAKILSIPPEKIVVIYNAISEMFKRSNEDKINEIKDRFGINDRFILYVGNQKPHKNVGLLIEGYQQLRGRINHQLVIVGQKDRLFLNGLRDNMMEGVVILGEISDEILPHFYSAADLYVSPSLYEGFGFSPLEAMACGTAVVSVKIPTINEIIGNAGYIVEKKTPQELAKAIYTVLSDDNLKNSLVKKGFERIKQFSWDETSKKTLRIYEEVYRKKVLMIAYYFPPFGGVPVQRTLKFIKYLPKYDWEPVVLTVLNGCDHFHPNDPSLLSKVSDNIKIFRSREFSIYTKLIKFLQCRTNDGKYAKEMMRLRSFIYKTLWFPDEKNLWIPGAIISGLKAMLREDIAVIYVSGFPWSAFLVGIILSKLKNKPLVLDFRDAWTLNQRGVWNNRYQRFWEYKVLLYADRVIFATNFMRKGCIERYPGINKKKFITITNGYDNEDFQRFENKGEKDKVKFLITLTGTFNDNVPPLTLDQSPYYFLKGLSKLIKETDISQNIRVRFVGNFGENNKILVKNLGLENIIELTGHVSHSRSIEYQTEADLLLLIICSSEGANFVLTGKLFEYIGARKPILALIPDGEAKDLIIKEKLGKVVWSEDIEGIKNAIFELYKDWKQDKLKIEGNGSAFMNYDMDTLTKKLVDTINDIQVKK